MTELKTRSLRPMTHHTHQTRTLAAIAATLIIVVLLTTGSTAAQNSPTLRAEPATVPRPGQWTVTVVGTGQWEPSVTAFTCAGEHVGAAPGEHPRDAVRRLAGRFLSTCHVFLPVTEINGEYRSTFQVDFGPQGVFAGLVEFGPDGHMDAVHITADTVNAGTPEPNIAPVADAGADMDVKAGTRQTLVGRGSFDVDALPGTANNGITAYQWEVITGAYDWIEITGDRTANARFEVPSQLFVDRVGTNLIEFRLTVWDADNETDSDVVAVRITPATTRPTDDDDQGDRIRELEDQIASRDTTIAELRGELALVKAQLEEAREAVGAPDHRDDLIGVQQTLIRTQEALLNAFRCLFDRDVELVPGGC